MRREQEKREKEHEENKWPNNRKEKRVKLLQWHIKDLYFILFEIVLDKVLQKKRKLSLLFTCVVSIPSSHCDFFSFSFFLCC